MPDISLCYRFKADPSKFRQSWFCKSPNVDENNCDYYWVTKPIHKFNNDNDINNKKNV